MVIIKFAISVRDSTAMANATTAAAMASNNTHVNVTCSIDNGTCQAGTRPHAPVFIPSSGTYKVIILSAMGAAAVIGNTCVLLSIYRGNRSSSSKSSRSINNNSTGGCGGGGGTRGGGTSRHSVTMYRLLAQLAVADTLVAGADLLAEAGWTLTVQWYADVATCKFLKYMQMFGLYLSIFTIVLIGLDQYFAIGYPLMKSRLSQGIRRAMLSVWLLSAVLSIPQVTDPYYFLFY